MGEWCSAKRDTLVGFVRHREKAALATRRSDSVRVYTIPLPIKSVLF